MEIVRRHGWQVTTAEAIELQKELAGQVSRDGEVNPRFIAGVDVSINRRAETGTGAVVVLSWPELDVVEIQVVTDKIPFPYVPGLLSFREIPLLLPAFGKLSIIPDLCIVDGQGIAHPRRMGLAAHLGLFLDIPTVGCAKSRLCGHHEEPGINAGNHTELRDREEVIGSVVRTRDRVKPVYVSIGHKIGLPSAIKWVLNCCRDYRLPEPTRLAHQAAGGNLKTTPDAAPASTI
ncbi:MAG: deoxyribonuclease V [Dehalococcoidia bacterium]|jgi:deoxyribonuclease V